MQLALTPQATQPRFAKVVPISPEELSALKNKMQHTLASSVRWEEANALRRAMTPENTFIQKKNGLGRFFGIEWFNFLPSFLNPEQKVLDRINQYVASTPGAVVFYYQQQVSPKELPPHGVETLRDETLGQSTYALGADILSVVVSLLEDDPPIDA